MAKASKNKKPVQRDREESGQEKWAGKKDWETPDLEDVSQKVMAQPYIRFT